MNKNIRENIILTMIIIAVLAILGTLIFTWATVPSSKHPDIKCSEEVDMNNYGVFGGDVGYISCYGTLVQEKSYDDDKYYIYDHRHNYPVSALKDKDAFSIIDDVLYLIQPQTMSKNIWYYADEKVYSTNYFINGKKESIDYSTLKDINRYISIDIYSGYVTLYSNNLDEIPQVEREIFKALEIK